MTNADDHYIVASADDGSAVEVSRCPDCWSLVLVADRAEHQDWHSRARVNAIPTTPAEHTRTY